MNGDIKKDIDIVVIGGIGIDTNIYLSNQDIDFNVEANFTENIDYIDGAGDGLVTVFISSYYLEKYDIQSSLLRAQLCARYSCSLKGKTDSLITKDQLTNYYKIRKEILSEEFKRKLKK